MFFFFQLITLFFGANDLCSGQCYDKEGTSALQHKKKLQIALDYLQANLPRTLVNLVPVLGERTYNIPADNKSTYNKVHINADDKSN